MEGYFIVYITAKDVEEARALGRMLVQRRLAACANVIPLIDSYYWWKGSLVEDREAIVLAKTAGRLVEPLMAAVREAHSYEVPAMLAIPAERVDPAYLSWLAAELEDA